jgi:cytochrome c-type biogenesis protein CcmF
MDFGTILLFIAVGAGTTDILVMLIGPRLRNYETASFGMSLVSSLAAIGTLCWMAVLIFTNQFQYDYVYQTTSSSADILLKISALWAGQSGSLIFWTFLSFVMYLFYRIITRGYEDDVVAYRAAIIMAAEAVLIGVNAIMADPFRITEGVTRTDGLGLNPLLRTLLNVIHPPIVFIAYALVLVPFSVKLAGYTVHADVRNTDTIPVLDSVSKYMTSLAWIMLSLGIVIGGYWAYIVLGWGGYWAWDPVETTSLIPWLLLTGYYHAKPLFKNNDVLRDAFLVFAYLAVLFATWVTRSGILSSVHGFALSIVSWTMLATLLANVVFAAVVTVWSGYRDMNDESDDEGWSISHLVDTSNIRNLSLKVSLIGLLVVTAASVVGVVLPAAINLHTVLANPSATSSDMVSIGQDFFWLGFYAGSFFLLVAAFYCMETVMVGPRRKGLLIIILLIAGIVIDGVPYLFPTVVPLTSSLIASLLVPIAGGALVYILVVFIRTMAGREPGTFTIRKMGRVMLHLGLVILILGVLMSENAVYENNSTYGEGDTHLIAPNIWVKVNNIEMAYFNSQYDFLMAVTVWVIEGNNVVGIGYASIQGNPDYGSVSYTVYIQSSALRDVFIAITGFQEVLPNTFAVTIHAKILPLVSFVWMGVFFMVAAVLPMVGIDFSRLWKAFKEKEHDLYDDEEQQTTSEAVEVNTETDG